MEMRKSMEPFQCHRFSSITGFGFQLCTNVRFPTLQGSNPRNHMENAGAESIDTLCVAFCTIPLNKL